MKDVTSKYLHLVKLTKKEANLVSKSKEMFDWLESILECGLHDKAKLKQFLNDIKK